MLFNKNDECLFGLDSVIAVGSSCVGYELLKHSTTNYSLTVSQDNEIKSRDK